jgi:dCTP deaminase
VAGKSTWARRGLIKKRQPEYIQVSTLELASVGEVPVKIQPGMKICEIFVHELPKGEKTFAGSFAERCRPHLGTLKSDSVLNKLS